MTGFAQPRAFGTSVFAAFSPELQLANLTALPARDFGETVAIIIEQGSPDSGERKALEGRLFAAGGGVGLFRRGILQEQLLEPVLHVVLLVLLVLVVVFMFFLLVVLAVVVVLLVLVVV